MSKPKDIDAYIAAAPPEARPTLNALHAAIRAAAPDAEERIWYNVPSYHRGGQIAGFSVARRHATIGFPAGALRDTDRQALEAAGYRLGKYTVQVGFDQPAPAEVIARILTR